MAEILNTLPQRIYRDGQPVGPGETYEGDEPVGDGQVAADSAEADAYRDEHGLSDREVDVSDADVQSALVRARRASSALATSGLRDAIDEDGHTQPGTGVDRLANAPSMPANDPTADENLAAPATAGPAPITTGAVGEDHPADQREATAAAVLGGDVEAGSPAAEVSPEYPEGVEFATADAANKADELVAAGSLDPDDLEAGEGSSEAKGREGAFTVGDLEELADED